MMFRLEEEIVTGITLIDECNSNWIWIVVVVFRPRGTKLTAVFHGVIFANKKPPTDWRRTQTTFLLTPPSNKVCIAVILHRNAINDSAGPRQLINSSVNVMYTWGSMNRTADCLVCGDVWLRSYSGAHRCVDFIHTWLWRSGRDFYLKSRDGHPSAQKSGNPSTCIHIQ